MGKRYDDAALSAGYLRAIKSHRKLPQSRRAMEKEREVLCHLYGCERPIPPTDELADESNAVAEDEKVFHASE